LRLVATLELATFPAPQRVYAAAKKADVLLDVGKGTATAVAKPKAVHVLKRGDFDKSQQEATSGALSAVEALPARFETAQTGTNPREGLPLPTGWRILETPLLGAASPTGCGTTILAAASTTLRITSGAWAGCLRIPSCLTGWQPSSATTGVRFNDSTA
jgi:hypothetical protein